MNSHPKRILNASRLWVNFYNVLDYILKLFWFQDIEDEEDPHDAHFRYITEITILTVQLIVEFAKGLPAFTKIPQEDQITLLKVSITMR